MLSEKKSDDPGGSAPERKSRGLSEPYGLAVPLHTDRKQTDIQDGGLRCPSCGRKIALIHKWVDSLKAWYASSYRLIRCRRCGTRFAARRKSGPKK